ncbi:MAG: hypothetical protein ABIY70_12345 [Capsulimonas sp.]|uniref:hypothetical protein n=1 Tax=Capsulimonas sp. TaxID=2494211 RepID=UPI003263BAC6
MSLKGCLLGSIIATLCAAAGLLAGGVIGYYIGLSQQAAQGSSEEWIPVSSLAAPFGALVGACIGIAVGICVAYLAKLTGPAQAPIILVFIIAAALVSEEIPRRYQQRQDNAYLLGRREQQKYDRALARQQANYSRLASFPSLQYPGATLQPQRPGSALSMTSASAPQVVADYYGRVLATPLNAAPCSIGPSHHCWSATTAYQGVPLSIVISDDDMHDGGSSAIVLSTTDDVPLGAAPPPNAWTQTPPPAVWAQPSPSASPPSPPVAPADPLETQRAKIEKARAEISTLSYPGAQETSDGDPSLILNFTAAAPVDTVAVYYRDHIGVTLRPVRIGGKPGWAGDVVYHGIPLRLSLFDQDGLTYVQIT